MANTSAETGDTRVDLHLHSRASGTASNWWVRGLGVEVEARESYTPPDEAYGMARRAGMDFVTLTDHETMEGAMTLAHHPDFFCGEEVSARFPEDENYADVLVYGLDAEVHREAQTRRDDVYALVDYLGRPASSMFSPTRSTGCRGRLAGTRWRRGSCCSGSGSSSTARAPRSRTGSRRRSPRASAPQSCGRWPRGTGCPSPRIAASPAPAARTTTAGSTAARPTPWRPPGYGSPDEFLDALAAGEVSPAGEDGTVAKMTWTGFRLAGAAIEEGEDGGGPARCGGSSPARPCCGACEGSRRRAHLVARRRSCSSTYRSWPGSGSPRSGRRSSDATRRASRPHCATSAPGSRRSIS